MASKKKKTKDPLVEKYKRVRNTILVAPEVQAVGELVNDLIGMGGFDDGGLTDDIKKIKTRNEKRGDISKTGNFKKQYKGATRRPLADFKSKMKRRAEGGFTDGRKKIDKAPPFGVINKDDFKALKAMKKKSTGGSIMVPVKMGKNKPTKIM